MSKAIVAFNAEDALDTLMPPPNVYEPSNIVAAF